MPRFNQQFSDPFLPVSKSQLFTSDGTPSSRQSVILQTEEGQIEVGNVSEGYQLVPNEAVYDIALDVLSRSELAFNDAGQIFDGKRYRQRWILPELTAEPRKGDLVQIAFDLVNSYDGSTTYGLAFNALRLAPNLAKRPGVSVRVFLTGDSVACARRGQTTPNGYYNVERMVKSLARRGQVAT